MSKPKSEYSINSPQTYINKRNVDHLRNKLFPEWLYTDAAIQQIEQYGFLIR